MLSRPARIALLPGDGIGPEVMDEAVKVLLALSNSSGYSFEFSEHAIGGSAIDEHGTPLRDEDVAACAASDAVLLGAVGGPKWDNLSSDVRPEQGLLRIRRELGLFANLRPIRVRPGMTDASPLRPELVEGVDILVVRELTGGLYFGQPSRRWEQDGIRHAVDTLSYNEQEIDRVVRFACELARTRRSLVTSVDKANVLSSSRLWREVAHEVAHEYPDVQMEHVLVDSMAMQLMIEPRRFDVVVTENMFGDILTDEAAMITGSIGLLPSASLSGPVAGNETQLGLYEPVHGTAPDIAGKWLANPAAMILSTAMMLRHSLGLADGATRIEASVDRAVREGQATADLVGSRRALTTAEMGDVIAGYVRSTGVEVNL